MWGTAKVFCTMINSADELPEVDLQGNPMTLPAIDFNTYTLVLGTFGEGDTGWFLTGQNIVAGSKKITMYIHVERPSNTHGSAIPSITPFWGLYPKLPNLPIKVVRE